MDVTRREDLRLGFLRGLRGFTPERWRHRAIWANVRNLHGFEMVSTPILTPPNANAKLAKGKVPSYGITLQHHRVTLSGGQKRNLCPWAGHCTKVCVLDNGNGAYASVQRARLAKTELLYTQPETFGFLLGDELRRAVAKHGKILLRPNVNSDLRWERLLPELTSGEVLGAGVILYGYTKGPYVLETDGWVDKRYRVAYSVNEKTPLVIVDEFLARPRFIVDEFLARGGSAAVVTNRRKGEPVHRRWLGRTMVDADVSDEWIFTMGVWGDLTAKGRARSLIGTSNFVRCIY